MKKRAAALLFALCLLFACFPAARAAEHGYVTDLAGLLDEADARALDAQAGALAAQYACGVYLVICDDFTESGYADILDCAKAYFTENDLGAGEDRDGVLLMLSMAERDYALIAHGDFANASVTDYGRQVLEQAFLDDFADDDWYDGCADYLDTCAQLLELSQDGTPLDVHSDPDAARRSTIARLAVVVLVPCLIAGAVCLALCMRMRTVRTARTARAYLTANAAALTLHTDMYTHTTEVRTKIHDDPPHGGAGGTTVDSGGFSGSKGKF